MASGKPYDYMYKLLLIGDNAVGKTSMMLRLCEDRIDTSFLATIGQSDSV